MAVINNKELFQSYILTTAKYDFSVHEKRILYRIIELNQHLIEGKKLNRKYKVDSNLLGDSIYTLPISLFLKEGDSSNHLEVKKALNRLQKKEIVYEDDTIWASLTIIANPKIQKFGETVTFTVD
ncbi:RepB family plasmid replication initiator protein, partial [Myroides marinus]